MLAGKSIVIMGILVTLSVLISVTFLNFVYAPPTTSNTKLVHAGGGNATSVGMNFVPQNIEIKTGDSITWDNPTSVAEPHSVTFINDNKSFADFAAPFLVPNSTDFQSPDPSNAEPLTVPPRQGEPTKTVITVNARAYIPVVIDSTGKNITYLPPDSNYTMDGSESYVNSGWLWPVGQAPPGGPPISKFTMTFEKPGVFSYLCNIHPWMTGTVTVK